jgi:hypothetical protein
MKLSILFAAMAAMAMPVASHAGAPLREASIPFANHGGVDDWRAESDDVIYFKDNHRRWYRAELFGPAFDLPYTETIGIDASPSGSLDRWSAIVVRGHRYHFRSFEQIEGPPPKRERRHRA